MKRGAAYYAGGARVVIGGIPIRLARSPSAFDLADMRAHEKERTAEYRGDTPRERAQNRVRDANNAIDCYARSLGISVKEAKRRIEAQRLHNLANPVQDLSLAYDL
jgi:hypothetical protein